MNIGKLKALMDRQRGYLSWINFVMICYLFFEKVGFHWYYYLFGVVWIVIFFIDIRYIMPQEFNYLHRKSPVMREILRNTDKKKKP